MRKFFVEYWQCFKAQTKNPVPYILLLVIAVSTQTFWMKVIMAVIIISFIPLFAVVRNRALGS